MSGAGSPELKIEASGIKVAIVYGQWHPKISSGLLSGAVKALSAAGAEYTEIPVAGSFELPVVSQAVLNSADYDAVVALGVIIRGGTPHFEYVSSAATDGLLQVSLKTGKPVGFGVLTLDNEAQGLARAGFEDSEEDKGAEAALAALTAVQAIRSVSS